MVVHDTQYDAAGYAAKVGWGHSTMEYAVALAGAARVRRLVLYHHDPQRDDDGVDDLLRRARALAASDGTGSRGRCRRRGIRARGSGRRSAPSAATGAAATIVPAMSDLAVGVAIATSDPALEAEVGEAATAEGLEVRSARGRPLRRGGGARCRRRRRCSRSVDRGGGVLGVTRRAIPSFSTAGITDWIVLPASIAHIRTKLRAAVLRKACRWLAAPVAPDEEHRLAALHRLRMLDTPREERFNRFVEQAREITATPIALVSLVDSHRQWFKATAGLDATESHRDESFCAHAILGPDVLQVPDALEDPRFADNPAVTGPLRVRFYAGVPLALGDGSRVGTLCVADHRPRLLDDRQLEALRRLADLVVAELQATP